jgi:hypothetical protein
MAEVLGDEAGVGGALAQPRCGGVPQGMDRDLLAQARLFHASMHDLGEDLWLQPAASEAAEDRVFRCADSPGRAE